MMIRILGEALFSHVTKVKCQASCRYIVFQPMQLSCINSAGSSRILSTTALRAGRPPQKRKNKKQAGDDGEGRADNDQPAGPARRKGNYTAKFSKLAKSQQPHVDVWLSMSITDLAEQTGRNVEDLADFILSLNEIDTSYIQSESEPLNNRKLLEILAKKLGFKINYIAADPKKEKKVVNKDVEKAPPPDPSVLVSRPPVVTIMGHIDHGKTTLLDYLRKSRIVAGEHGGITQHIGAFSVHLDSGLSVTFIDTPGHAAFTAMRTRGATCTDIVILIVDACEGILQQTKESLRIIRQARVPYIIALNKIDKPDANIEQVKEELTAEGVRLEENGGDIQCVPISAMKGTNVSQLIESVLTLAEVLELKADPEGSPEGIVIESQVEQGLGKTATVLLTRGTLKLSDHLVGDEAWCRVRLLLDDRGERLRELKPGGAAKVVGWKEAVPHPGCELLSVDTEARAREVINWRKHQKLKEVAFEQLDAVQERRKRDRESYLEFRRKKLELGYFKPRYGRDWPQRSKETEAGSDKPVVHIVIKGDVDGSIEAILACLDTYNSDEVALDIVSFGIGQVSETDINMAQSFNGIIYAFNTTVPPQIQKLADSHTVPIRQFNVIYHMIDDLKTEISAHLPLAAVEDVLGRAQVQQEFMVTVGKQKTPVAGCRVKSGKIARDSQVRVIRNDMVLYEGHLSSLKHLKSEVHEIIQGQECGLGLADQDGEEAIRFQPGDQIISYTVRHESRTTDWDPGF